MGLNLDSNWLSAQQFYELCDALKDYKIDVALYDDEEHDIAIGKVSKLGTTAISATAYYDPGFCVIVKRVIVRDARFNDGFVEREIFWYAQNDGDEGEISKWIATCLARLATIEVPRIE